jgi:hypothetical protein
MKWEDSIKMDFSEIGCEEDAYIELIRMNFCINDVYPSGYAGLSEIK